MQIYANNSVDWPTHDDQMRDSGVHDIDLGSSLPSSSSSIRRQLKMMNSSYSSDTFALLRQLDDTHDARNGGQHQLQQGQHQQHRRTNSNGTVISNGFRLDDDEVGTFRSDGSTPEPPTSPRPRGLIHHPRINKDKLQSSQMLMNSSHDFEDTINQLYS